MLPGHHGLGNEQFRVHGGGGVRFGSALGCFRGAPEGFAIDVFGKLIDARNHFVKIIRLGIKVHGFTAAGDRDHFGVNADGFAHGGARSRTKPSRP